MHFTFLQRIYKNIFSKIRHSRFLIKDKHVSEMLVTSDMFARKVLKLFIYVYVSDWQRKPRVPGCTCLHTVLRRPVWRPGPRPNRPEVHGAEKQRWSVLLCLPWRFQPQPVQAALSQPDEQRGIDGRGEERRTGGSCQGLWVKHPGEEGGNGWALGSPARSKAAEQTRIAFALS